MNENEDLTQATVADAAETTPSYSVTPEVVPTPKNNLVPIIVFSAIGVILITALVVVGLNYNYLYAKLSPEKYCLSAATKAEETISKRQMNSPFAIFEDYEKAAVDGTISAEFELNDTENDMEVSFSSILKRDVETAENEMDIELGLYGIVADFNMFFNDERLAFNSSLFEGNETYALDYDNLASRLNDKLELGISDEELDEYQKAIDASAGAADFNPEDYDDSFLALRDKFLEIMPADVSYEKTTLGGVEEKCIAVKYTMTEKEVVELLNEYLKIVESDEKIKEGIGAYPSYFGMDYLPEDYDTDYSDYTTYDMYVAKLEYLIELIEENYVGTTNIALYSNKSGCLVKVEVSGNAEYYDDMMAEYDTEYEAVPVYYTTILDLGSKPQNSSAYSFIMYAGEDEEEYMDENYASIVLSEKENTDEKYKGVVTIDVSSYNEYMEDYDLENVEIVFTTNKSSGTYDADIDVSETSSYDGEETTYSIEIRGDFSSADGLSEITVDSFDMTSNDEYFDFDSSATIFTMSFSAEQGADLAPIDDYKELDDWTDEDIEKMYSGLEEYLMEIFMQSYGGYSEY